MLSFRGTSKVYQHHEAFVDSLETGDSWYGFPLTTFSPGRLISVPEGDDPPRDRTGELRILGFPTRHLGSIQMTTDTALGVTKLVVQDQIQLNDIPYIVSLCQPLLPHL